MLRRSAETARAIRKKRTASLPEHPERRHRSRFGKRRRAREALAGATADGERSASRFPR